MLTAGIDPGTFSSGVVVYDTTGHRVVYSAELDNRALLLVLRQEESLPAVDAGTWKRLFVETVEPMGLTLGTTTLETMRWVGRFQEAWERSTGRPVGLVHRSDEKTVLCGASTFLDENTGRRRAVTDAQIRAAVIERFPATGGGKVPQVGIKASPGPLYGVKGHAWSALAVLLTGLEINGDAEREGAA